ncbi:hypothetical protein Micbo1qcDRAFT_205204 [Microdochium bolleyi]|uniref:Uncharacterized protein n=1 Tax=Microdochium bolleyi TaxID=196109 RepID=A0A136IZE9_9PEZI|nr:hypothetical protein Micbo1qcDRAFT_205204 [Microdochium bolleyi]
MKFLSIVAQASLLALPLSIEASPVDITKGVSARSAAYKSQLVRRDCPSQETIDSYVASFGGVGASTVFYTATNGDDDELERVKKFAGDVGGVWYESAVSADQIDIWDEECTDDEVLSNVLSTRVSIAIAKLATGTTYVLLGKNAISSTSTWVQSEYPILNGKSDVNIVAVNLANTEQKQDPYVAHQNPWQS